MQHHPTFIQKEKNENKETNEPELALFVIGKMQSASVGSRQKFPVFIVNVYCLHLLGTWNR